MPGPRSLPLIAMVVCIAGCSVIGASRERDRLTEEAIEASDATTVLDAIDRQRPQWLGSSGRRAITDAAVAAPSVFVDGQRLGDTARLADMALTDVVTLQFWYPREAAVRFGAEHPRGAIEVTTR